LAASASKLCVTSAVLSDICSVSLCLQVVPQLPQQREVP